MYSQTNLSNHSWHWALICSAILLASPAFHSVGFAQNVSVFPKSKGKPVRGELKMVSPEEVLIGQRNFPVRDARKFTFGTAPGELKRAKSDMATGQFLSAWNKLNELEEPPTEPVLRHEYEYAKAFIMGKLALSSGQISTKEAGSAINAFINKHPKSYRLYPMLDLYGQLLVNINRLDLAEAEFAKLAQSNWPEYQLKGLFNLAETQMMLDKLQEARQSYTQLKNHELNDQLAQRYKLMATCQDAKAAALQGDVDQAITTVKRIIKNENADNSELFALCYNTLGVCQLEKNELRAAAIAFLHTDLLFPSEASAHSEALYHLAKIWPLLDETDRANNARTTLSGNYANSIWNLKLKQNQGD